MHECHFLFFVMLSVIMMSVIMLSVIKLSVIMLSVVMLNVMAPNCKGFLKILSSTSLKIQQNHYCTFNFMQTNLLSKLKLSA
jgi:hypothetical protein